MGNAERRLADVHRLALMVESLELRLLLSSSPSDVKSGPLRKIGDELASTYLNYTTRLQASPTALSSAVASAVTTADPLLHSANGQIQIEAYASGSAKVLASSIKALNATNVQVNGKAVTALVPVSQLGKLAALSGLRFAQPAWAVTNVGATTSQGDQADAADVARSTYSVNGAGIHVGILSDSFDTSGNTDTYAKDVLSGDLPSGVQNLDDFSGPSPAPTDEGRAMAQVIYDSAPGVGLMFDTSMGGQSIFAQHIKDLALAGADIIVDDTTYLAEPMFQDGVIAQAAEGVIASGIEYISAAGNNGHQAYESAWRTGLVRGDGSISSAVGAPHFFGGTTFDFDPDPNTTNDQQSFTLGAGQTILLSFQWDSPYFSATGTVGSGNDMDMYVLNSAGNQIVGGSVTANVGGDPTEVFAFTNNTGVSSNFNLMLAWNTAAGGSQPGYLKYVDFAGQATNFAFATNSGSAYGHSNAGGVESVGAAAYSATPAFGISPPIVEAKSSAGPTPIFFDNLGNRLATSVIRQTPEIVAPDRVNTTFFGTDTDFDGLPNFFGTSAAAASAAGVAALLLQKAPTLTPAQLNFQLQSSAIDMGVSGVDFSTGYGLIQADAAIVSVGGSVSGTVYHDNNGDGVLDNGETGLISAVVYWDANNDGILDNSEINFTTGSDGIYTLSGITIGSAVIRDIVAGEYVPVPSSKTVSVTASGTTSGINLGVFRTTFLGSSGNDTYTLQVDSSKTTFFDVLLNGTLQYTFPIASIPAVAFTPGSGTDQLVISFLNGNPIPGGGLTYDGGASTSDSLVINCSNSGDSVSVDNLTTSVNGAAPIFGTNIEAETVNGNSGNDTFTLVNQPSTETFTFNGGVGNDSLTVKNALPSSGANTFFAGGTTSTDQDVLTVSAGTFQLVGDPQTTTANLTVNDNANVIFTTGTGITARHLAAMTIGASATATVQTAASHANRAVMVLGALTINTTGKLDLGGNDAIVKGGNLSTLFGKLTTGFAAHVGYWNGSAGIVSSTAATNTKFQTTLGIIQNTTGSAPLYSTFDGQSSSTNDILIKYTYYGDADLNGSVGGSDYVKVDVGFGNHTTGWVNGDFNYDGVVNGTDFALIDNMFNFQGSPL